MELNDFQELCKRTAVYPPRNGITYCVMGLVSEAGEVAGKLKKYIRGDYGAPPDHMARISEELGDVLWYAAMLSTEIGVQLNDVAEGVLTKLEKRMEAGTIKGSGDIR